MGSLITNPLDVIEPVSEFFGKVIDKIWPDKTAQAAERAKATLAMAELQQNGDLKLLTVQMSAILAEAQSADPWTSRARPSFLYVIYVMILMSIPIGFLSAFRPDMALAVAAGMKAWLAAIPEPLYALFGVGYVGYAASRSYDKKLGVVK